MEMVAALLLLFVYHLCLSHYSKGMAKAIVEADLEDWLEVKYE